jgi:predicted lactoylglutathione lyase
VEPTHRDTQLVEWSDFSLMQATDERGPTRRLHLGFAAPSRAHVDAFWRAGIEAGHPDDGTPGPRPQYREDYYGAFLLDPDGNSAEAVHHGGLGQGGVLDHLWIRVADVAAARAFYLTVAPHAGLRLRDDGPERVGFAGTSGSFSLVAGPPSEHVHLAFTAARDSDVDAFHRAVVAAGHRDNGPPGERPEYHPGYYAAYALDPDGTNVEVVVHHRS